MQIARKRMAALSVTICALVALAFGGVYAIAAGHWWDSETNSLTVIATNEHMKADIASGATTVQVDVYKIADAEADENSQTFNYDLVAPFVTDDMKSSLAKAQENSDGGKEWERLALSALELVANAQVQKTATIDKNAADARVTIDGLPNGLYLVLPHGAEADATSLIAAGATANYKFKPSMVSLPTKLGANYDQNGYIDPNETITTDQPGDWKNAVNIALKVEETPVYGSLKIIKKVTAFAGSPITCKFHIQSTPESPYYYENTASVYVSDANGGEVVVTGIPAGAIVTVEESYPGAGYQLVPGESENGKTLTIPSDAVVQAGTVEIPTATFTNAPTEGPKGHGVQNTFEMVDGEWTLVEATPSDANHEDAPSN